jgi:hypothetical protein
MRYTNLTSKELNVISASYVSAARMYSEAQKLSQVCYVPRKISPDEGCYGYVERQIIIRDMACPFMNESCLTRSIQMDSGYLDSNDDLGINAPNKDRIQFRRITTCAVLAAEEKYSSSWTPGDNVPRFYPFPTDPTTAGAGSQYKIFYLGSSVSGDIQRNFTFIVANFSSPANPYKSLLVFTYPYNSSTLTYTPK